MILPNLLSPYMRWFLLVSAAALLLASCSSTDSSNYQSLPAGDASRGVQLFRQSVNGAPPCASCHSLDGSVIVGPSLKGISTGAGARVAGTDAANYIYQSITRPAAYIVSGYNNLMYNQFDRKLTPQQIADLIAYLLTL